MSKSNKNKIKLIISIIVFLFFLITTLLYLFYPKVDNTYKDVVEKGEATSVIDNKSNEETDTSSDYENNNSESSDNDSTSYINQLPNFRSQYGNDNIVAYLKIPSLNLATLITRTGNNKYYLNHDLSNNYNDLGNPFMDFRNKNIYDNMQVNIYGHNTNNSKYIDQLPFSKLLNYMDETFYNNNKSIILDIDEAEINYQIIAVKIINNSDNEHMVLNYSDANDWNNHISKLLSNTLYNDNVNIGTRDKLLVLQACNYNPKGSYILVIAKKIN